MKKKYVLITGSDGLVGSESVLFFSKLGYSIIGIDNNSRKKFFGQEASILKRRNYLKKTVNNYYHFNVDITSNKIEEIFKSYGKEIDLIIHCAGQPSHDWAASNPKLDFNVNSYGTLNILENMRKYSYESTFIFTSTNKVYGDNPNKIEYIEKEFRYTPKNQKKYKYGINENFSLDNTVHSLFGVSKLSADMLVQEYGKYFDLRTVSFRGGCLTGSGHAGTKLHGFLSYLIKCIISNEEYTIFGYKGKQVRDNIHSSDLVNCFYEFYKNPKYGEVYNIGGGVESNCSMIEAIKIGEEISGKKLNYKISSENRIGDHIWYVSDLRKFKKHFPEWKITFSIEDIIEEIISNNFNEWSK
tara:strand:- start:876 stop:1943 length:1068 start_codon:yes stop_codon:yes gene_type:complete